VLQALPVRSLAGAPWWGDYYQLVESYRPEGVKTPRQRFVMHLGRYATVDDALHGLPKEIRALKSRATRRDDTAARDYADDLAGKLARLRCLRAEGKV